MMQPRRWMRRALGSLAIWPLLALAAGDTFVPAPVTVALSAEAVAPGIFSVHGAAGAASAANEGFIANAGFVITDAGVVVFDSLGSPELGKRLIREIHRHTAQPIRRVIVSHYHADHSYGLAAFKAAGVEIWAHAAARDYLASPNAAAREAERQHTLARWIGPEDRFLPPDRDLVADTRFTLGQTTFRVIAAAGHTAEDLALFVEDTRTLFAGDLVFSGRLPFIGTSDSRQWLATLDRLIALEPAVLVSGHGPPSPDPLASLRFTRDYLQQLRAVMGRAVADLQPFDEAYAAADWSTYAGLPLFAETHRTNAYNTYLLMEQEALQARRSVGYSGKRIRR